MTASTAASGPVANFRRAASAATWQRAAMTCALFASGIGVTAPAQAQAAPNVRITTPSGDFLVDVRPLPRLVKVPHPQLVVADQQTPPRAVAMPSPVAAPAPAPSLALAPAPAAVAMPTATAQPPQSLQSTQVAVTQTRPAMSAPAVSGTVPVAEPAQAAVKAAVNAWATAWASKDIPAYLASYGPDFAPEGKQPRPAWEEVRRARIAGKSRITVKLSNLAVAFQGNRATAKFR